MYKSGKFSIEEFVRVRHGRLETHPVSERRQNRRVEVVGGQPLVDHSDSLRRRSHEGADLVWAASRNQRRPTSICAHLLLGQPLAILRAVRRADVHELGFETLDVILDERNAKSQGGVFRRRARSREAFRDAVAALMKAHVALEVGRGKCKQK